MNRSASRVTLATLRGIAVVVMLCATLLPLVFMITTAFKTNSEILVYPPTLLPANPTIQHFADIFSSDGSWVFFRNSLIATSVSTVLTLVLAVPAAYALAMHRFPFDSGRGIGLGILLLRFLPPFAIVIPLFIMLKSASLLDSVAALVIVYTAFHLPLAIWIVQPAVAQIPKEISEAAAVDGNGPMGTLWRVILPLLRPSVATAAAFCTIFSWNEFFFALVFTSNRARTYPLLINSYVSDSGPDWGAIAATSLLAVLPVILLVVLLQRQLIGGLTAGAVR
jgi:multiple sugar transport system permease protein